MGSFKGHALPGTLFLAVGAWHVWAALARFAADPAGFRLRVWNPVEGGAGGALRHLELYVVAGGAFVDMCVEVLYSTHLRVFVPGGGVNPAHLNDLEHGGMLLMFFLFGALALLSQKTSDCRMQVPAVAGGRAVPGCSDSIHGGVPALLLPLHHPPGAGGLLPLPPRGPHRALRRVHRPRRAPPGELTRRPRQRRPHHPAGPVVLPDGVHALRVDAARGVPPRRRRARRVPRPRCRGARRAARYLPALRVRLPRVRLRPWLLRRHRGEVRPPGFEDDARRRQCRAGWVRQLDIAAGGGCDLVARL